MNNDQRKTIFYLFCLIIIVPLFFAGALFLARWLDTRKVERIAACHTRATGNIYEWQSGLRGVEKVWVEYFVNNERYEVRGIVPYGIDIDVTMSFGILYDQGHPAISRVDFVSPFFAESSMIRRTTGWIEFMQANAATVQFFYEVSGVIYSCKQLLPEGRMVKVGERYPVEYLAKNPRKGILKLDVSHPDK
jgi:hypothetical protein